MSVNAVTHLNFRGNARQALQFYHTIFGGDLSIFTYRDMGNVQEPSEADQVTWGQVTADNGFRIMAYDVPSRLPWNPGENGFFVSLRGETSEEISAYWEKLAQGATIVVPLAPAQWSPLYGMLKDAFGVVWVVDVVVPYRAA